MSRRSAFSWTTLRITDPAQVATFRLIEQPHTIPNLVGRLAEAGFPSDPAEIRALMDEWLRLGIVFTDGGYYVHVAPISTNQHLMRIDTANPEPESEPESKAQSEPVPEPDPMGV